MNDDNLKFKPNYPYTLPEDWHNRNDPSIYEIMATLATLKKMYEKQVLEVENGYIEKTLGEKKMRHIATNYQTIKSLLFQSK